MSLEVGVKESATGELLVFDALLEGEDGEEEESFLC